MYTYIHIMYIHILYMQIYTHVRICIQALYILENIFIVHKLAVFFPPHRTRLKKRKTSSAKACNKHVVKKKVCVCVCVFSCLGKTH